MAKNSFYKSKGWLRVRPRALRRDEYLCQECKRYGKSTAANTVHHIFPLELYPTLALVLINLISLCTECHGKMHNRITNEITTKGIVWQNRIKHKLDEVPPPLGDGNP